jgi:hypothetical protein
MRARPGEQPGRFSFEGITLTSAIRFSFHMASLDSRRCGEIHRIPPVAIPVHLDQDTHWHLLLGTEAARAEAMLVFGTSSIADCSDSAPCYEVDKHPPGPAGVGVTRLTHFNGGALIRCQSHYLTAPRGCLPAAEKPRFLATVADGIGRGSGLRLGTKRGAIAVMNDLMKKHLGTRYGVLLTSHTYSRRRRYHVVVPLVDNARRMARSPEPEWLFVSGVWTRNVTGKDATTGFYAMPNRVESAYYSKHIEAITAHCLRPIELDEIERRVGSYLGL